MPKPIRRRLAPPRRSPVVWILLTAAALLLVVGGVIAHQRSQQGTQTDRAAVEAWTNEILDQWKRGGRHARDGGLGPIYNLNAWSHLESEVNAKGTRLAVRYTIDSASQAGVPARVNWTFAWVKQSKGWTLCAVLPTDEAGPLDSWRWQ